MSRRPVNAVQVTRPWTWGSGTPLSQLFAFPKSWYIAGTMGRGLFRRHPRWTLGAFAYVCCWWFTGSWVGGLVLLVALGCLGLTAWVWWRGRNGVPASLADLRVEDKRRRDIKRQWPLACDSAGLTSKQAFGGGAPSFHRRKLTANPDDGSFVAAVDPTTTGIVADDLAKHANRLAKVIGCRDVLVRELDSGKTQLTFYWTDALGRHVSLADVPFAPEGMVSYGVRSDGKTAATIDPRLPVLFTGLMGRGKSSTSWAALADMLRQGMHVRLYLSDVKITELARFRDRVGIAAGTLDVRAYENSIKGADAMFQRVHGAFLKRAEIMAQQGIRKLQASEENPAVIVWVDEVLPLQEVLKAGAGSSLAQIASQGRAAHYAPWVSAQVGHVDALGRLKSLMAQRVVFGTDSWQATDAAFGFGATARGVDCHKGLKPGRGWSVNEHGELLPFKAAFVRDDEADLIAQGIVPDGMALPLQGERTALYRHFDSTGVLLYVGISNDYMRRSDAHEYDKEWWKQIASSKVEWWANRTLALEAERLAIETEHPAHNEQHNSRNANRVRRPRVRRPKAESPLELAEAAKLDFADARQRGREEGEGRGVIRGLVLIAAALWAFWTYWLPQVDVPYVPDWMIPGASCTAEPREPGGIHQAMSDAGGLLRHATTEPPPTPDEMRDAMVGWVVEAGRLAGTFDRAFNGQPWTPPPPASPVGTPPPAPATGAMLAARAGAAAGWSGSDLVTAVAIAGAESRFIPTADNPTSSAMGLWQVMVSVHGDKIAGRNILDPYVNAQVAYQIWSDAGGFDRPWAQTYGAGKHLAYMDDARAAVAALSAGGVIPAGWDPAAGCEPGVIPAGMPPGVCPAPEARLTAETIRACRVVVQAFGPMTVLGWGTRGNATEHDDGRALDFMTYADQAKGQAIANYLQANAAELDVLYLVWRQQIWSVARADEGWRAMEDRGSPTANHMDHVHVSLEPPSGGAV